MINQTCGAVSDAGPLVLVAEDDESAASAVMLMLARDGISCVRAVNGSDALEHFARRRPDVVILDVMMPVLDGFQVCERIRQQDEAVPVLFLTAKGDMVDKRIGYSVGADDYLVKPFSGTVVKHIQNRNVGIRLLRGHAAQDGKAQHQRSQRERHARPASFSLVRNHCIPPSGQPRTSITFIGASPFCWFAA